MTVFDLFPLTDYEYLEVDRGGVYGNKVADKRSLLGVFKLRSGRTMGSQEVSTSEATLHVQPSDFPTDHDFVGDGVRVRGVDYQIVGVTEGFNFETNEVEHYRLTLERADYGESND